MTVLPNFSARMLEEQHLLKDLEHLDEKFSIQEWISTDTNEVHLKFELKIGTKVFLGILVYPELFPDVPAHIQPQQHGERWSSHQYGGSGVLCLEYGPDNWHHNIKGVRLIQSAQLLLLNEVLSDLAPDVEPVQSRHSETVGQKIRKHSNRLLCTPILKQTLNEVEAERTEIKAVISLIKETAVFVVTQIQNEPLSDIPASFANELNEISGWAIRTDSCHLIKGSVTDISSLEIFLNASCCNEETLGDSSKVILIYDLLGNMDFFYVNKASSLFIKFEEIDLFNDKNQRLPMEFSDIHNTKIAIIGLGSLGSKIAISLARSGCSDFCLVDDDIFAPHNIVRNELNWLDVGFSKTYAVERALKRISTEMRIKSYDMRIGGQENPLLNVQIVNEISSCNLIIDATANAHTFVTLAAIAKRKHISIVWGEIFGGGGGAMMARSRPILDAPPLEIRNHIHGVLSKQEPIPEGKASNYGFETPDQVYIASDADVTALSAAMTQFILDILCPQDSEPSAYPASAYLIGFRKYWIFKCPFDTYPIDCSGALVSETLIGNQQPERQNIDSVIEPQHIED
ncbi:ThiF family adenylyltransferase [Acinetobacter junii]|uniref:ThiF family adenylyltransferase n=1 Tax=Acinetobacter junii TaxID=40215 RepID=A0ABU8ZEM4_ACIJU